MDDFVIARNPEADSRLPYLLRIPLGSGLVVKARDTWPRTAAVYCHAASGWPDGVEIVERTPVRTCRRRGAAIDLVLDRARENRSQFVFAHARGREVIFWQTARVLRAARPAVRVPATTAAGAGLAIVVDVQERYPYRFTGRRVATVRRRLRAGDYAVEHEGAVIAAVERKTIDDLAASALSGKLAYALAELSSLPHAAVVVEERYSRVFRHPHVRGGVLADALAEAQVRWPSVPIIFCETRALAEDWTVRYLAAAIGERDGLRLADERIAGLPSAPDLPARQPTTAEVRTWALSAGLAVADRGRLRPEVLAAYAAAH